MKTPVTTATVRVRPGRRADHPLSKAKFAAFNSGIVHAATYRRDLEALRAARPESVRIDIGWGAEWIGHERTISEPSADGFRYDFSELDEIGALLNDLGIRPCWSYCYVPSPYQLRGGDWRDLAEDDGGWVDMISAYVEGARDRGVTVGYHEVYNEPDLRDERTGEAVFFGGDLDDYLGLYRSAATAIRKADPDTPVGGPALASVLANEHWIPAFLDLVTTENLPLDFFSFHHYGTHSVGTALDKVLGHLESRPELADVEIHLNEYNSYPVDYPLGGLQDTHHLAAAMLADFATLLATPGLTKVSWAQFLDSGHGNYSGMVDIDGRPKPILSAYVFYQTMPVDRCVLELDGPDGVGGLAGIADGRLAVALWNRSSRRAELRLDTGDGRYDAAVVRRIDAEHDGTEAERSPAERHWTFDVPRGGVVLLELTGPAGDPARPAGTVRKVRHRYTGRRTSAWADLDEATTTFRLGTASDPQAVPVIAADLTNCGPSITVTGRLTDADGSAVTQGSLTVRLDGPMTSQELELGPDLATADLASFGAAGDVRVTVALRGAPAHTFAVVELG
ncbi:glycoside hydrolase family 39 [Kribbella flavida DSM 17836]|uniref:Glycoside hydrolase family 39 n=1 Tax=Kribbella flavida (strain DSM 17836 / JCM 10339 / NBRC 14399) TaxID=479435 RepID=D2PTT1_KRIFD|nr:glycoside hydrolase family 39 [Kribbella flavida]ADB33214.1 glycoside hydrolase family 39 [Kribbella flavida DSM 17836]